MISDNGHEHLGHQISLVPDDEDQRQVNFYHTALTGPSILFYFAHQQIFGSKQQSLWLVLALWHKSKRNEY